MRQVRVCEEGHRKMMGGKGKIIRRELSMSGV